MGRMKVELMVVYIILEAKAYIVQKIWSESELEILSYKMFCAKTLLLARQNALRHWATSPIPLQNL